MPIPQQFGRGDRMGRGPYEKSGIIEDNGLPPNKRVEERFEVPFPMKEVDGGRQPSVYELDVQVKLWYLPFGTMDTSPHLWREFSTTVAVSKQGK
jgi:hypothetical protein